jgi:ribosomal protein S18 acetylase RimI-like enzyme
MTEIRAARTVDEIVAAEHLFDGPVKPEGVGRFLVEDGHHLLLAYPDREPYPDGPVNGSVGESDAAAPVGFVSGVEVTHPDKGTEMFLYELAVAEAHRRRGVGRALVEALAELARQRGCYGMWVLTDRGNPAALAAYRGAGAAEEEDCVLLNWSFPDPR